MQIPKSPSAGELIERTSKGHFLRDHHLPSTFTSTEVDAFNYVLADYRKLHTNINRVAVFHALSDYLETDREVSPALQSYFSIGIDLGRASMLHLLPKPFEENIRERFPEELRDDIYTSAEEICEKIKYIENAISSPEKVVIRNDRSEDLGADSAVLSNTNAASYQYGVKGRNTIMIINGPESPEKQIAIRPLLRGVTTVEQVQRGSNSRWAINQNAVTARFEQWCAEINKVAISDKKLEELTKKRRIMRVFNTYVDVMSDTTSTFLNNNETLQEMIEENIETIANELIEQLKKYAVKCGKDTDKDQWSSEYTKLISKYHLAFELLGLPIEKVGPVQLLTILESVEKTSTSQLYEAA